MVICTEKSCYVCSEILQSIVMFGVVIVSQRNEKNKADRQIASVLSANAEGTVYRVSVQ